MKFVRIKQGPFKGRIGKVLKEENGEALVAIEGEDKPVRIKIDWVKVLNTLIVILGLLTDLLKRK